MVAELVAARHLLALLAWRDVAVRYKQSFLGIGWAVVRPLATMIVFTFIFGGVMGVAEKTSQPYPLFLVAGMLPWMCFHTALMGTGTSLVLNRVLVTKVYFTRLALPLSASATPLIDLAVSMVVLLALMAWYGGGGIGGVAIAAASIGTLMITAWAVGLTLAAVLAWYRDLKQGLPFVLQAWMFLGPVVLPIDPWGDSLTSWLAWVNPVAGSIMAFRAGVTGAEVPWLVWGWSAGVSVVGLWGALLLFSWLEEEMGDVI